MTTATRNRLLDAVHRRAAWLAETTSPGHPARSSNLLIAMAARNLFGTVIALCGFALQQEWLDKLFRRELASVAVCPVCQEQDMGDDAGMCETCFEQGRRDDDDVRQAVLMAQPHKGLVS